MKRVLDVCCGSRMFWFDRFHLSVMYADRRQESVQLTDRSTPGGSRNLSVMPDVLADFRAMPFTDGNFDLVVFDPPHFARNGVSSWMAKKYGSLNRGTWRDDIKAGFRECFRVCRVGGTVVFKWNETEIALSEVLSLAPQSPLFGNRFGKHQASHWLLFYKSEESL